MTGNLNSAGRPTPIKHGGCPWCGMGIQGAGTADAYCGWCPWPDAEDFARRMARLLKSAKPRVRVRVGPCSVRV